MPVDDLGYICLTRKPTTGPRARFAEPKRNADGGPIIAARQINLRPCMREMPRYQLAAISCLTSLLIQSP